MAKRCGSDNRFSDAYRLSSDMPTRTRAKNTLKYWFYGNVIYMGKNTVMGRTSCGFEVHVHVQNDRSTSASPISNHPVDKGRLCVSGHCNDDSSYICTAGRFLSYERNEQFEMACA